MEPTTTIVLDTYYVEENDQKAAGAGETDTATVTFISTTDPTKPPIPFTTTNAAEIAALVPGTEFTLQLVAVTPPVTSGMTGSTDSTAPASSSEALVTAEGSATA